MITVKDRKILKYIEKYKYISIDQARQIAFPTIKSGYQSVRKRLHRLVFIEKKLKVIYDENLKLNLYMYKETDIRKIAISPHRLYLMDFFCCLVATGCTIEKFEIEKEWSNGKFRSDALIIYVFEKYRFCNLIEVNQSNNLLKLGRFDQAKDEIIKSCNGSLPRIILIDDRGHKGYDTKVFEVFRVNCNLTNFSNIFI